MDVRRRERETVYSTTPVVKDTRVQDTVVDDPAVDDVAVGRVDAMATDPYNLRRARAIKALQIVYLVFGVVEALVAMRFVLKLLGASTAAEFTSFVYGVTWPLVAPFSGMFRRAAEHGRVFEPESLVALVVYLLLAWLIARVVWLVLGESRTAVRSHSIETRMR